MNQELSDIIADVKGQHDILSDRLEEPGCPAADIRQAAVELLEQLSRLWGALAQMGWEEK